MDGAKVWANYLDTQTDVTGVGFNDPKWGSFWKPGGAQAKYLTENPTEFQTSFGDMIAGVPAGQRRSLFDVSMDDMAGKIGFDLSGEDLAGKFLDGSTGDNKQNLFDVVTQNIVEIGNGVGVNVVPGFGGPHLEGDSAADPGMQAGTSAEGWE
tara:strand:- start:167 stop:625 length:459 start_codon:yes stop_codon:yes gene_type:complete